MEVKVRPQLTKEMKREVEKTLETEGWGIMCKYMEAIESEYTKLVLKPGEPMDADTIAKKEVYKHIILVVGQFFRQPYTWIRGTKTISVEDLF